jgi:hypothetical protein
MQTKKELLKNQLTRTLEEYPIVVWCQRVEKSTNEWLKIKKELGKNLSTMETPEINYKFFQTKSKLLQSILNTEDKNISTCQGHIVLYGCKTPGMLKIFVETMSKEKAGFVVGGIYDQKTRSFKDLEKLQNLTEFSRLDYASIFHNTIRNLYIINTLKDFNYLSVPILNLLTTVNYLKLTLEKDGNVPR